MSVASLILWLCISYVVSYGIPDTPETSNHARSSRSAGGHLTPIEFYPYTASLRYAGKHICGGSILSANVILTAGHCIPEDLFLDLFYVKVGDADINYKGSWHPVVEVVKHEGYGNQVLLEDGSQVPVNDIALLKLGAPINIDNKTTQIIELFKENDDVHKYSSGLLSSWGVIGVTVNKTVPNPRGNGTLIRKKGVIREPASLKSVELNIGSEENCSKLYPSADLTGQFCTYTLGKKSCAGGSGSPFEVDGRLAGITSWGFGPCNEGGNAGFFTDITKFHKWINEKMKTLKKLGNFVSKGAR